MKLAGQVALVTGSGQRLGRAIALALAEHGANVVVNALANRDQLERTAADVEARGAKAVACLADVRDRAAVEAMVGRARLELGPVDILVSCPAPRQEAPFEELSIEAWHQAQGVVLDGAFNCMQAAIGGMLELGRGSIISILGLAAQTGLRHRAHIVSAKTGLLGLTRALALEYAGRGITVNAVSPAYINRAADGGEVAQPAVPVGRLGTAAEVAALCCFLASEDARYITGQNYAINGGMYIG